MTEQKTISLTRYIVSSKARFSTNDLSSQIRLEHITSEGDWDDLGGCYAKEGNIRLLAADHGWTVEIKNP